MDALLQGFWLAPRHGSCFGLAWLRLHGTTIISFHLHFFNHTQQLFLATNATSPPNFRAPCSIHPPNPHNPRISTFHHDFSNSV
jgi:hypothetical protein